MLYIFKSKSQDCIKIKLIFDEDMDKNKLGSFLFMHPVKPVY